MSESLPIVLTGFLLRGEDVLLCRRLMLVEFPQEADGPILELGRNLNAPKKVRDLLLQLLAPDGPLGAQWVFLPAAVVVGVAEKERHGHAVDTDGAARTRLPDAVGKLESALAAHELVLLLGGDTPAATATVNEAGEGKLVVRLRTGIAVAAQKHLHPVILRAGDHPLVLALMPAPAAPGILELAVVEGLGEELVDGAQSERLAAHPARAARAESPVPVRQLADAGRGVRYGVSITDACLGWKDTETLLRKGYEALAGC